jgi:hypothetical protein
LNIFGYGEARTDADIVVSTYHKSGVNKTYLNDNITREDKDGTDGEVINHKFMEAVGHFLIAFYHIIVVIVLLNMLIAMMANTYDEIYVSV